MPNLLIITHPEVVIDPDVPIPRWGLSVRGRERATVFASGTDFAKVTHVWTSTEQKAKETGDILAAQRHLPVSRHPDLGENDRSATGFLPPDEFEAAANAFFARPNVSYCGWETAN